MPFISGLYMKRLVIPIMCIFLMVSMTMIVEVKPETSEDLLLPTTYETVRSVESFDCYTDTTLFTSPDSSYEVLMNFLNGTKSDLMIATYQFNCQYISEKVSELASEGVNVTVLVDGEPVNGLSGSTLSSLTRIKGSGGSVNVVKETDFTHFHGKYILRDEDHVLITSENLGRTGFSKEPTWGNRGWGVIVNCSSLVRYYRDIYEHDLELSSPITPDVHLQPYEPYTGYYDPQFESPVIDGNFKFTPVTAPETSSELINMIEGAEESIFVQQFYIRHWGYEDNPLVEALKDAALRGIMVKVQLDSTYFHTEKNQEIVDELNQYAKDMELDLEARLVGYRQGFQSVHNKGMIVDRSKVLVSSINWNLNSYMYNREIALIIENEEAGEFFSNIFLSDWKLLPNRPIADAGRDIEARVNEIITFDGSYSWDDQNISKYQWDLTGDGIFDREGAIVRWAFDQKGTYEVTLRVVDKEGDTDVDTVTVSVSEKDHITSESRGLSGIIVVPILVIIFIWLSKKVVDA